MSVSVSDGALSATVATAVAVSNVDEAGTVALTSTKPQVGTPLTATLSDPDGSLTGAVWQWQRRASATADWADVPAGAEGASGVAEVSSYTPQAGDVGLRVQARVRYRDGHSQDATDTKTARSATTEGVVGPPAAPASLTATPGDRQVALTWQAPASDGGASITGYEYRQSKDGGTNWQPDWTAIANSDAKTTSHTVTGLTNGHGLHLCGAGGQPSGQGGCAYGDGYAGALQSVADVERSGHRDGGGKQHRPGRLL